MVPRARAGMALYTHSIPAVVIGAALAAALWTLTRRPGACSSAWDGFSTGRPTCSPVGGPCSFRRHWWASISTGPARGLPPRVGGHRDRCAIYARGFPSRADFAERSSYSVRCAHRIAGRVDVALSVMRTRSGTLTGLGRDRVSSSATPRSRPGRTPHAFHFAIRTLDARCDGDGRTPGHRDAGLSPAVRKNSSRGNAGGDELEQCGSTVFGPSPHPPSPTKRRSTRSRRRHAAWRTGELSGHNARRRARPRPALAGGGGSRHHSPIV